MQANNRGSRKSTKTGSKLGENWLLVRIPAGRHRMSVSVSSLAVPKGGEYESRSIEISLGSSSLPQSLAHSPVWTVLGSRAKPGGLQGRQRDLRSLEIELVGIRCRGSRRPRAQRFELPERL